MTDRAEKFIEQAYKKLSECNDLDSLYDSYMKMVTLPERDSFEYIYACGKALQRREEELEKEKGNAECDSLPNGKR